VKLQERNDEGMMKLLTPAEAAEMLSVSEKTVKKWLRQGKLRGVKVAHLWRLRKEDLERFIKES